jgi:serine/threonine-protein kinase HipA
MTDLVALLDGREVGILRQARGRLSFHYEDSWRSAPGAYPLSLSLPLAAREHSHSAVNPFLWGLLPDNEVVLDRWARRFQVSARNPFALIGKVGEDCAGAVQFVTPDRLELWSRQEQGAVAWLTEAEVAERLRRLQTDVAAWRAADDSGQFSLAGAQPKTALYFDGQRWGVPAGRAPTTHIIKPPTGALSGHAENEHLCLALARSLGLPAARSEVRDFDGINAIVVARYDRVRLAGSETVHRVHQEDMCQALGRLPWEKYESDGGPGPRDIVDLLRLSASGGETERARPAAEEDIHTFVDALIFNWLAGGTDAHAKNYSLLMGAGGLVRLAPLYDVASVLAYPGVDPRKARLAMKIGGKYRLHDIGRREWRKLAATLRLNEDAVTERARAMSAAFPDHVSTEIARASDDGLRHPILPKLARALTERAQECTHRMAEGAA